MQSIYLDHAATTPLHPEVIAEMNQLMTGNFGNPSSVHHFGRKAQEKLTAARKVVADSLQAKTHEIIFNSGGTEGANTAILGVAQSRKQEGKHIITTAIEHHAVLNTMNFLETQGFEVTYLPVNQQGQLELANFEAALRADTILVSIMFVNNETGNYLPIKEIGARLKEHSAYFHTDAVQAYGLQEIVPQELGIDLLSASAHKINGPKGVGFLYKADYVQLPTLFHGGQQEEKRRPGTENLIGIAGLGQAVTILTKAEKADRAANHLQFQTAILQALDEAQVAYQVNGDLTTKSSHILNLRFNGQRNDLLLMKLDLQGIAVSTGSACTAGAVEPSHVITAMYPNDAAAAKESVRISFGYENTAAEIDSFIASLLQILQK
ncbi:cysteine desulfurase [Enterococcus sp. PF1-24]|uniref:cysteine desulfurase family protein n=1 Tax=unclassified Enterococcus TaxID=2608891 RepID=UPI0024739D03|nr:MULTISPECIES: cysteine desulfurase family protein [unclassified Enterococcus]MDH6363818.1 cysteine desulfurase [Enterococcus sp. PFB1-1]MDH6400996.1 cysteine desulfurase [Enterococcus sp. PF1-24]